jgi:hypothetical protein
MGWTLL